ncbi:MAG: aspartate/glutamate racemase family protein [SAR202 cluster bacterium]|nr:aspartate/glutamate racemase family protein [SAR202 cluster bacterium]
MIAGCAIGIVWPGVVTPEDLTETQRFVPEGVSLHMAGPVPGDSEPGLEGITVERVVELALNHNIAQVAAELLSSGVSSTGYGCTSASYVRGVGGDIEIGERMAQTTGLPATTTSTAMVVALRQMGVKRVAVLSPHIDALNEHLGHFLEDNGFQVEAMTGLNKIEGIEDLPPEEIMDIVVDQADRPDADGIFVSCTGMRTATVLDEMERRTGKPVVTALQATVWHLLGLAGARQDAPGLGSLFVSKAGVVEA